MQGQYVIPKIEVTVAGTYLYASGITYTLVTDCLLDPNGMRFRFNQGRVRYFAEPRGSRRLDPISNLDFRVEKFFSFDGGTRLGVFADVFNVFNQGEAIEVNIRDGSTFGDTRTLTLPRRWRFGIRYAW